MFETRIYYDCNIYEINGGCGIATPPMEIKWSSKTLLSCQAKISRTIFCETKLRAIKFDQRRCNWCFNGLLALDSVRCSCSLALFWTSYINIYVVSYSCNHIKAFILNETCSPSWHFVGLNGEVVVENQRHMWIVLHSFIKKDDLPWVVCGV